MRESEEEKTADEAMVRDIVLGWSDDWETEAGGEVNIERSIPGSTYPHRGGRDAGEES
jgi:hypothetical protein